MLTSHFLVIYPTAETISRFAGLHGRKELLLCQTLVVLSLVIMKGARGNLLRVETTAGKGHLDPSETASFHALPHETGICEILHQYDSAMF